MTKKYVPLFEEYQEMQHVNEISSTFAAKARANAMSKYGLNAEAMYPNIKGSINGKEVYDNGTLNVKVSVANTSGEVKRFIIDINTPDVNNQIELKYNDDNTILIKNHLRDNDSTVIAGEFLSNRAAQKSVQPEIDAFMNEVAPGNSISIREIIQLISNSENSRGTCTIDLNTRNASNGDIVL